MTVDKVHRLPFAITGLSTQIGRVLTIAEGADPATLPERVVATARDALLSADRQPHDIDAMIVVTCSPYEVRHDQDAFRLARELGLDDAVLPIQIGAGCAGLARAVALAAGLRADNVLIVTYNAPGRAALVLSRRFGEPGLVLYSRGPELERYDPRGMMLNHASLQAAMPGYVDLVRRVYTHQAGPAVVGEFGRLARRPEGRLPTNAARFGNLVSASTVTMLHDDLFAGHVVEDDLICVSVAGAGPERGAYILPVRVAKVVEPGTVE